MLTAAFFSDTFFYLAKIAAILFCVSLVTAIFENNETR